MKSKQLMTLLEIPESTWQIVISKLYGHLNIKLKNKTQTGAHSEQRLKVKPFEFYIDNAIMDLYEGTWEWKQEQYALTEQLIRIIDSKISEEVRKYKVEQNKTAKTLSISHPTLFPDLFSSDDSNQESSNDIKHCEEALARACDGNKAYTEFVKLKRKGLNYDEICQQLGCTKKAAYQMMETIARRANRNLNNY